MNTPYEILLRFDDAGAYRGGHTIRRNPATGALDPAQPIGADTAFPWPAVASEINLAALAANSELTGILSALESTHAQDLALLSAQVEEKEAARAAAAQALATAEQARAALIISLTDAHAAGPEALSAAAAQAIAPEREKRRAALQADLARISAELSTLIEPNQQNP